MFTYRALRTTPTGSYALASSEELDEAERTAGNYEHPEFSFIIALVDGRASILARFSSRIEDFAVADSGAIHAVGVFVPAVVVIENGAFRLDPVAGARSIHAIRLDAGRAVVAGESTRGAPFVAVRTDGEWQVVEAEGEPFEYVYACRILSASGERVVIHIAGSRPTEPDDATFAFDGSALTPVADASPERVARLELDWPFADNTDYVDVPSDAIGQSRSS